ncbi:hypothetical protein F4677DRAFT_436847 [Hypoxylon crocopeplum]|nr:hypothetical protein F4677DRAFT_436847 [Hypoxylon crocopeplum]
MFGGLVNLVQSQTVGPPPKNVPPPTPIRLPQCNPQLPDLSDGEYQSSLVRFLQQLHRPAELNESHFAALGVHVHADAPAEEVVPDSAYLPPSSEWDGMSLEDVQRKDENFRRNLRHGGRSPEARTYLERRIELSIANQAAFRTVRRIKPEPGKLPPRLGNCYEFFKQMELMCAFWEDTSLPPLSSDSQEEPPPLPPRPADASSEQPVTGAAPESNTRSESNSEAKSKEPERVTYRTTPGSQMPAEFRHNFITAFIKLVAWDFGCNVNPPRVEPRLQLLSPPDQKTSKSKAPPTPQVASYFPSGCVFLCQMPTTREAARAGTIYGPIGAVSARNTTNFSTPADGNIDFGRELVAALITAQHRTREGQPEKRFGEGKWWATEKRWGGGEGGPIGREVDGDSIVGDKDAGPGDSSSEGQSDTAQKPGPVSPSSSQDSKSKPVLPIPMRGQPASKKPRKNLSIYDSYRMVRLPTTNWDKKTKYQAIGKKRGAGYDDVFVLSSLFHHLCVLRVRVPDRLLDVLNGAPEPTEGDGKGRSWGKLEMWRSKWFDLFIVEERLEAMRVLWGVLTWAMRAEDADAEKEKEKIGGGDVAMKDA